MSVPGEMFELLRRWGGASVAVQYDHTSEAWFFIAIHDDRSGYAVGGTRTKCYATPVDGLWEAMRLAEGMTRKWAALELAYGGAKAVICLTRPPHEGEREPQLRRFARFVDAQRGAFGTGPDLGTHPEEVGILAEVTPYVHCWDRSTGRPIDPGPYTALGVFVGIEASLEQVYGEPSPEGRVVLVQGVGDVGAPLAERLAQAGATVLVSDIDGARAEAVADRIGARVVAPERVYGTVCDVYSPCAVSGTLNAETIPRLRCRIVAGSANVQLGDLDDADRLRERGILYAPDYIVNGGGAAAVPLMGTGAGEEALRARARTVRSRLASIFNEAERNGESPARAAERRVEAVLRRRAGAAQSTKEMAHV